MKTPPCKGRGTRWRRMVGKGHCLIASVCDLWHGHHVQVEKEAPHSTAPALCASCSWNPSYDPLKLKVARLPSLVQAPPTSCTAQQCHHTHFASCKMGFLCLPYLPQAPPASCASRRGRPTRTSPSASSTRSGEELAGFLLLKPPTGAPPPLAPLCPCLPRRTASSQACQPSLSSQGF